MPVYVPCAEDGCSSPGVSRTYCFKHYNRRVRAGQWSTSTCMHPECDDGAVTRGLCQRHYTNPKTRPFGLPPRGRMKDGPWFVHADGYVRRRHYDPETGVRVIQMQHRVVMEEALGRPLERHENVHHRNGVKTDNAPENLELWSIMQPSGQRIPDKVAHAKRVLALYEPEALASGAAA